MANYVDNAVFIPGTGAVLLGDAGTDCPEIAAVKTWARTPTQNLGNFTPAGYTSLESLPSINTDTSGGEVKGVWENANLRKTKTTVTDSVVVNFAQWTQKALKHRFGSGGTVDATKKQFTMPSEYLPSEVSLLIVYMDGSDFLVVHYRKASSSPEGNVEASNEDFMTFGVKYTILQETGKSKGTIMHGAME